MGFEFKDERDKKYKTVNELANRIIVECDEEYPWMTIIRECAEKIRNIENEKGNN